MHFLRYTAVLLCTATITATVHAEPLRVACVGDSITFGSRVENRGENNYPVRLGHFLGKGYTTRNFGVSGATLLSEGNKPWIKTKAFKDATAFNPDIVVINLGANDTKPPNIGQHEASFVPDYLALIQHFRNMPAAPTVYICNPVHVYNHTGGITQKVMDEKIRPKIAEVARKAECNIIDLSMILKEDRRLVPDGVHPGAAGAEIMAKQVAKQIGNKLDGNFDIRNRLLSAGISYTTGDFHGYPVLKFKLDEVSCRIVLPHQAADSKAWVWRARFFGHQPQFDVAMLQHGWHVAYCDVSNLFGSKEALARWDRFYELAVSLGLDPKPFLEGMSRGGLIIYNWAKQNPENVCGIYADNPVCDGRSWPGGKGAGDGSPSNWERLKKAYGIDETNFADCRDFPLDGLEALAAARVPVLHVIGLADKVVPPAENSDLLLKAYREFGGPVKVIEKPDGKHHPHCLPNPQPIVDFALESRGQ